MSDPCAAYVSMLRARRLEDERTRKRRSERRADVLNLNVEGYKKRERDVRSTLMIMKLKSLSRVENDLFDMLDEQSQWRHVMRRNVEQRTEQQRRLEADQAQRKQAHLEHALKEEAEAFAVGVADDRTRWQTLVDTKQSFRAKETRGICESIFLDVIGLAGDVVDYLDTKHLRIGQTLPPTAEASQRQLLARGPHFATPFELMPRPVYEEMKLQMVYHDDDKEKQRRVLEEHVAFADVDAVERGPGTAAFSAGLGALVRRVTSIMYPPPAPLQPKEATNKTFIVLSGPKYSGKSAVARAAAAATGLEYVSTVTVTEECLAALEDDIRPEDLQSPEVCERLSLGRELRHRLQNGDEVGEELTAQLTLFKIRTIAESSPGLLFDGMPATPEAFLAVESQLSGLSEDTATTTGTPGASVLAQAGSPSEAFDPKTLDVERVTPPPINQDAPPPATKEAKRTDNKPAATKKDKKGKEEPEEPLPPIDLPPVEPVAPFTDDEQSALQAAEKALSANTAGLRRLVRIDCAPEELFKRYSGLRVDVESGEEYHVASNPPPLERVPFIAMRDRSEGDTAKMHVALESDRERWSALLPQLQRFDGLLKTVDGNTALPNLIGTVTEVVQTAVVESEERFQTLQHAARIRKDRVAMEALVAERVWNREALRKQLLQLYQDRGVDPLPAELLAEPPKSPEEPTLPIPDGAPRTVLALLNAFEAHYGSTVYKVHHELATLMTTLFDYCVWTEGEFERFCATPDGKQKLFDAFVKDMNAMPHSVRCDVQGKEELHLRADTLWEALAAVVERRSEEGNALIETMFSPASFVDGWCDAVRMLGSALVQLEVERFTMVRQVASAYYGGIKGDPLPTDEAELLPDLLVLPRSAEPPVETQGKPGKDAKGKGAVAAKGKGAPPPPPKEDEPRSAEDLVSPMVDRALSHVKGVVDRLSAQPALNAPTGKAKPGAKAAAEAAAPAADGPSVAVLAVPFLTSELEATRHRLTELGRYVRAVVGRGLARNAAMRHEVQQRLKSRVSKEMSAVSGSVLFLRSLVEEESPVEYAVRIDGATFVVDYGCKLLVPVVKVEPLSPPAAAAQPSRSASPAAGRALSPEPERSIVRSTPSPSTILETSPTDVAITSVINSGRMYTLIQQFRAVAPDCAVQLEAFARVVSLADWSVPGRSPASVAEVFRRFDQYEVGVIDWREFLVHLLLWSEPLVGGAVGAFGSEGRNPYYVDGPSLLQLYDLKTDLGSESLSKDAFFEVELFFEGQMELQRLTAFKETLWRIFAGGEDAMLDPNSFLLFLCSDPQPLRGTQKAFAMASEVGDDLCNLDVERMYSVFHFSSCNLATLGISDTYSYEELDELFAAAGSESLNFQDVCAIGMGRVLLNNTLLFRRKSFDGPVE